MEDKGKRDQKIPKMFDIIWMFLSTFPLNISGNGVSVPSFPPLFRACKTAPVPKTRYEGRKFSRFILVNNKLDTGRKGVLGGDPVL